MAGRWYGILLALELPVFGKSNMLLSQRNPSLNWEPVPVDPSGQSVAWAWFRPATIPTGMMFAIPASLFADMNIVAGLSLRRLVALAGLDPGQILCWTVNGMNFDAVGGTSPLLDQILPFPANGTNLDVSIWMAAIPQPGWPVGYAGTATYSQQFAGYPGYGVATNAMPVAISSEDQLLLEAIESNWKDIIALDVRVSSLRKEIGSVSARLGSLNRDLSSHERLACSTKDIGEWADCRRALRDAMLIMSRSVKEIDLGTTSGAGRRHQFEEIHENHVVQRKPFPGIQQAVNEFETYRKILQSVIGAAQASLSRGGRDAEMKAGSFLQRIHAKAMTKRKEGKFLFSKSLPPPPE